MPESASCLTTVSRSAAIGGFRARAGIPDYSRPPIGWQNNRKAGLQHESREATDLIFRFNPVVPETQWPCQEGFRFNI